MKNAEEEEAEEAEDDEDITKDFTDFISEPKPIICTGEPGMCCPLVVDRCTAIVKIEQNI